MKYLFFFLCSGLLIAACTKENTTPFSALKVGSCETAVVSGASITICLDSVVNDSRCPKPPIICVWQGAAKARFSISINDAMPQVRELDAEGFQFPNHPSSVIVGEYKITFKTLSPYPGDVGYSYDNFRAGLEVVKQ